MSKHTLLIVSSILWAHICAGCDGGSNAEATGRAMDLPETKVVISDRQGQLTNFPCQDCHKNVDAPDGDIEGVAKHTGLQFDHFEGIETCTTCHSKTNRNKLQLLTGEQIAFSDSHRLCGQCHGEKIRDWETGAHGKLLGGWRGTKHKATCADCHHPHIPKRDQVTALPAPPFPKFGIPKKGH